MQSINNFTKKIVDQLLQLIGKNPRVIIEHYWKDAILFQLIARGIKAEDQTANLYSLRQFNDKENDTGMEMQFLVADQRVKREQLDELFVYPILVRLDGLEILHESVLILDDKVNTVYYEKQAMLVKMAEQWLIRMQEEGFLDPEN